MSAKIPVNKKPSPKREPKIPPQSKAPAKETIYIDVDDEITSIINKVDSAKAKVLALVLPKRANALQSVVNMRLLKRSAERAGKNIVLVTGEAALLPLAGAVGLHISKNLQSAPEIPPSPIEADEPEEPVESVPGSEETADDQGNINPEDAATKIDYKKSIGELAAAHGLDEEAIDLSAPEDELPVPKKPKSSAGPQAMSKKLKVPNFERFRLILFGGIALLVAFIIFIIFAILVLPKGMVTISTTSLPVSANLTLDASDKYTAVDGLKNQIPASLKATKQTANQTVNATGQLNQGVKATGSITMSAQECNSSLPSSVLAGSGVSSNGLTYITQQVTKFSNTAINNGGGCFTYQATSATPITAQTGGSRYNLSAVSFTVSGRSDVSGTGSASGGTDNNVTIVSQSDVDSAKAKVTSASSDTFTKTFEKQLADQGFYVLTSTLKPSDPVVTATPAVGTQATSAAVTVEVTYSVLAVKKDDLRKIIGDALNKQVDKSKQKLSNDDVLKGATVSVQNQTAPAAATLNVSEDTTAIPIINVAQIKTLAAGKKSGDIKTVILATPGVKNVEVKFSPFWVTKAKASKITVKLVQVKA